MAEYRDGLKTESFNLNWNKLLLLWWLNISLTALSASHCRKFRVQNQSRLRSSPEFFKWNWIKSYVWVNLIKKLFSPDWRYRRVHVYVCVCARIRAEEPWRRQPQRRQRVLFPALSLGITAAALAIILGGFPHTTALIAQLLWSAER